MAQKKQDITGLGQGIDDGKSAGAKKSGKGWPKSKLSWPKSDDKPAPKGLTAKLAASAKASGPVPPPIPGKKSKTKTAALEPSPKLPRAVKPVAKGKKAKDVGAPGVLPTGSGSKKPAGAAARKDVDDNTEGDGAASRREARRRPAGPVRERIAANDDVPSIGGLIYALQQKPSSEPFKYAAIGSIVWASIGIFFGWFALSSDLAAGATFAQVLAKPTTFITLAGIVMPIAVIWFLSVLAWRAEELRLRSSTMTEVAVRLAEPDRMAEQSVASLGQAVRRQVSFMNDAVSRALGRAGELEALVHNEVAALENSYEENERKIRGLINELAHERESLSGTGGEFADTLKAMSQDVPALIEKLSGQQSKLAGIIGSAGDNLTLLETSLTSSADNLESSIGKRTQELHTVLEGSTEALDTALSSRGDEIRGVLVDHSSKLQDAIGTRTDEMRNLLGDYTMALAEALGSRTEQMESTFTQHLEAIDTSLGQRTDNLENVFEEYGRAFDQTIGQRTDDLQSVFEQYGNALDASLATRAETLDTKLIERTRALDSAFDQRLQLFDDSILRSTKAIDHAVGEKAQALTSALDSHAKTFSETISQQSADIDESLVHGINSVRRSSENITRQSLKAIEGLAGQSDLLRSVSENLLGQINTVSNRFDNQSQTIMNAAGALESANFKIDSTLRTRQNELSDTLNRMSGKADEFGKVIEGYSSSIESSLGNAEQRALAAAEELKAGAQTHRDTILADFDDLRVDATQKSERALEDLRTRFSSVSDELTNRLGSMAETVDDTTGHLRDRTAQAATDIAKEQARLKAELANIPSMAREGSETMRRALKDQLSALERLSEISKKRASGHDVSAPVNAPAAPAPVQAPGGGTLGRVNTPVGAPAQQGSAPRAPNPDRGLSSLSSSVARELAARGTRTGPAPVQHAPAPAQHAPAPAAPVQARSPVPRPGPRTSAPIGTPLPSAQQAQPTTSAPVASGQHGLGAAVGAGVAGDQRDGWSLGDLLQNASFDDDEPATSPKAASPEPVAQPKVSGKGIDVVQIARAMEPNVAAQIWARLRSGQRGFLKPEVYTPEGRVVFDDLRFRSTSDAAIGAVVQTYLGDFERSLRDLEASDSTGQQVQAQLISESGRVYLFLAHVSGRLG